VLAIGQLDKGADGESGKGNEGGIVESKWTPAVVPSVDLNKANATPSGKNTPKSKKKKGSKSDGKKEDATPPPPLPSGSLTESTGELRAKLRGMQAHAHT
jgi:hypothetical protein